MSYLEPPPMPAPVVVMKDVGGLVTDYQARTELYRAQNREVRLHECRSACTLALSLPNVCVYPDSILKFHQAYNEITKEADLGVSGQLWSAYPPAVREKLGNLTRQYKALRGSELIALGVRNCNAPSAPSRVMVARARPSPQSAEGGGLFKGVESAVSALFGSTANAPVSQSSMQIAARPQPTPGGPSTPTALHTSVSVPLPPPRPPLTGLVLASAPPAQKYGPDHPQTIHGAAPVLEARFVPLKAALARLASAAR